MVSKKINVETDARVVDSRSTEAIVLTILMVLIWMSFAALGRDIFFNPFYYPPGMAPPDRIGLILPHVQKVLCFVAIMIICVTTSVQWALSKVAWMFAPFCILAFLSMAWSDDPHAVLAHGSSIVMAWLALSIISHRIGMVQSAKAMLYLIAGVCLASMFMVIVFPHIGKHDGLEYTQAVHAGRWRGIFAHKNGLGPWAAFGSVFLFTHAWLCPGHRWLLRIAHICAVLCLVFSQSATGLAMAVFMIGVSIFFYMLRRLSFAVVLTTLLGCAAVMAFVLEMFHEQLFALLGRDDSFSGRDIIWKWASQYFWSHPWLGNGFGSLGGTYFLSRELVLFHEAIPGPESAYFTLLLELGFAGAICFIVPYLFAIRNGFEWLKHVKIEDRAAIEMYITILLTLLINGITESNALMATGFDGIVGFTACFSLMTTPKSPEGVLRGEFRLAKYRLPLRRRSANVQGAR